MIDEESMNAVKRYIHRQKLTKLRVGIIEDPTLVREYDRDGTPINYDPMEVKVGPGEIDGDSQQVRGVNIVNTITGQVSIRWLDGDGGGHILPQGQEIEQYVNQTINSLGLRDSVEPILNLSMGLWGGLHPGTGYLTIAGLEFMPPAGSVVIVGYTARERGVILGYFLPNYTRIFNSTSSQYTALNPGEVRLTSYGGSYIHLKNLPNNSKYDETLQVSDVEIGHTLGGFISYSSVRGDKNGQYKVYHPSGANFVIDDEGGIALYSPPIEDFTEDNLGIVSGFISILKNGAIAIKAAMDMTIGVATSLFLRIKDQLDIVTNSLVAKVSAGSNITLNAVDLSAAGKVNVSAYEDANFIFNKSVSIDCRTGLKLSAGGKIKITQDGSISFISQKGNIDLIAVGSVENSSGGVCTAQTVCPVTGFHIGAIGNTVRASNIAPSVPGAPL